MHAGTSNENQEFIRKSTQLHLKANGAFLQSYVATIYCCINCEIKCAMNNIVMFVIIITNVIHLQLPVVLFVYSLLELRTLPNELLMTPNNSARL